MKRVVIVGPGASGKSQLARRLGLLTGLPVVELDKRFWRADLMPLPPAEWASVQHDLVSAETWILDGDLGPHDALDVRLGAADTVIFLDFPLLRCALRALRRSPERLDFWIWLLAYRWRHRPEILRAIQTSAAGAALQVLRNSADVERFVAEVAEATAKA